VVTAAKTPRPLDGIRVLELGNFIAAPTAARVMAEFGAEVIKLERPRTGDEVRNWRLYGDDISIIWRTLARNKKSVTLDLGKPQAREIVQRLVRHCDVLLENFRPGRLEAWGLGPDALRQENPRLIIVRISGFGQSGPYRERVGFGGVAEAMGGLRGTTGYPDRPPTRVGVSIGDTLAGLYAVIGALMAIVSAERGGDEAAPETVDVALTEAVLSVMESLVPDYSAYGVLRERTGNRIEGVAPSNTYPCLDGEWVVIGGNADRIFPRLMAAVGRPDLATDTDLRDNAGRVRRADELDEAISAWTRERTVSEVVERLVAEAVPVGPIYDARGIVADEQFRARSMFVEDVVPVHGEPTTVLFPGIVPRLERQPGRHEWVGPALGAHTREVLTNVAGLSESDLDELASEGVI
jgi:formyl-CoA transferase